MTDDVRASCDLVCSTATHVSINDEALEALAKRLTTSGPVAVDWNDGDWHYTLERASHPDLVAQYVFVLDTLNFCFWPSDSSMEYDTLARGLRQALEADETALSASALSAVTAETVRSWLAPHDVPLIDERVRKLQEVGRVLSEHFGGSAAAVMAAAKGSASRFVDIVLQYFPGFRDQAVYKGSQVFFYKRAQILVTDMWAAYGQVRRAPGDTSAPPHAMSDLSALTMFADYRVPQLLRAEGVMVYSDALAARVDAKEVIPFSSEEEVEIRAFTVVAVERLRTLLAAVSTSGGGDGGTSGGAGGRAGADDGLLSVQVDWMLWQEGEKRKDDIPPHHRTLTCFY